MFGHPIGLNYDKKGTTFNTTFGGFISTIVNILLFAYLGLKFINLFGRLDNSYALNDLFADFDTIGSMSLTNSDKTQSMQMLPFISFYNTSTVGIVPFSDLEIEKHIHMEYEAELVTNGVTSKKIIEIRECVQKDFDDIGASA